MIQDVKSFVKSRLGYILDAMDTEEQQSLESAFKEYAETVIDECAHKAEIKYIKGEHGAYVDKESITAVKEQIS